MSFFFLLYKIKRGFRSFVFRDLKTDRHINLEMPIREAIKIYRREFMTTNEIALGCRTFRRFLQKEIPLEIIQSMLENARISPSSGNMQKLKYIVVRDKAKLKKMQDYVKFAGYLPPALGMPHEDEKPVSFIVIVKDKGSGSDIDVGIACHAIITTAYESGIGSCIMGAIDRPSIKELLEIDEEDEVSLAIAQGYPACKSSIVSMKEDQDIKYYVDQDRNYFVPKRNFDDIVRII